jgi:4-amino-4-deoxy-L-arabinose transferase-like glycosyltransferase
MQIAVFLLLLLLLTAIILLAWVPPVSRDALVHHLTVPKLWLQHGGMYEMPGLVFSYYPMNVDLLYLIPLYFGNDILPKLIHFAFGLATAALIFTYLNRHLNRLYAAAGALTFLSTPIIVRLCISAYVDLGLVFFATAGLMAALKWHEDTTRIRYLLLSSLCCGLALGTKYNGLIVCLLIGFVVMFISTRTNAQTKTVWLRTVRYSLIFALVAVLVYSPWGIRNYLWTGNPVYPLFENWFNPTPSGDGHSLQPIVFRKLFYQETWWQIALVPLRIFFQGQDNSPQYFDGKLNPFLLLLPLFLVLTSFGQRRSTRNNFDPAVWAFFALLLTLIVFLESHMRIRYMAPAIPGLVILTILSLEKMTHIDAHRGRPITGALLRSLPLVLTVVMLSVNGVYVVTQFKRVEPFDYQFGRLSRDQYIEKFRPEHAVIRFANRHLDSDATILALFIGKRGYYCERDLRFDVQELAAAVNESDSTVQLRKQLLYRGLSHLLIRYDLFVDWCNRNLDENQKQLIFSLLNSQQSLLLAKNGHALYKLE